MGLSIGRTSCKGLGFTRLGALLNLLSQLKAAGTKPRQIAPLKTVVANMFYTLSGSFYRVTETLNAEVLINNRQFESHYQYLVNFGDLCRVVYAVQVGDPILYGYWKVQMVVGTRTWAAYGETFAMALFNLWLDYLLVELPERVDLAALLKSAITQPVDLLDELRPAYTVRTTDGRLEYIATYRRRSWPGSKEGPYYYEATLERLYL